MVSVSTLIDFLMDLMRDDAAAAAFERDPQAALAGNGLDGVTGQDIRDARLIMADDGAVQPGDTASYPPGPGIDDAVHEIRHTVRHYQVDADRPPAEQTVTVNIDDRDTVQVIDSFNTDSFNGDATVTVVDDSFNSDDDTTDVEVDVVAIDADNAFNDNSSTTEVDDITVVDADDQTPDPEAADQPVEPDEPVEPVGPVQDDGLDQAVDEVDEAVDEPEPELATAVV